MIRINERGYEELYFEGQHLKLYELKRRNISNDYLYESVPAYPQNVEFQVSYLRHSTNLQGYHAIWNSEGFIKPKHNDLSTHDLVWWSPDISRHDITNAEERYLNEHNFDTLKPFLHRFTSSPAFLSSSRLGNFYFSMPIHELLRRYQQQFCPDQRPNIRIFETVVYKQEVMYSIVIHAPCARDLFSKYPLLQDTHKAVCVLRQNTIVWRPQAMSQEHSFVLSSDMRAVRIPVRLRKYYVWDNIGVAFHVPHGKIFSFSKEALTKSLRLCEGAYPKINTEKFVRCEFAKIRS